jgi:hypothetical protein
MACPGYARAAPRRSRLCAGTRRRSEKQRQQQGWWPRTGPRAIMRHRRSFGPSPHIEHKRRGAIMEGIGGNAWNAAFEFIDEAKGST